MGEVGLGMHTLAVAVLVPMIVVYTRATSVVVRHVHKLQTLTAFNSMQVNEITTSTSTYGRRL